VKVAILGAGAIGAYMGAALAQGGSDVQLIARGANLEALQRDGVRVLSPRGDFSARVPATDDPREIGACDVVVLGLKAHHYADAGPLLEPLLGPETAVVAAQNGIPWWYFHELGGPYDGRRVEAVDPGGAVSAAIPPERAIGCVVYSSTELEAPGVVRHIEGTRFSIGEPDCSVSERCRAFSDAMIAGGLKCPVEPNIRDDVWIKLMGNVAFNPLSALTRATLVAMCRHQPTRRLVTSLMEETLEIARRLGQTPEISIKRRLAGAERVGEHRTSTLQDLDPGKRLELAPMTGALIELADLTDVDAPSLRAVGAAVGLLDLTLAGR
jgi:2-dehydropantoate 2-reductase